MQGAPFVVFSLVNFESQRVVKTNSAVLALVFSYGLEPSAPIWKQLFFQVHATLRPGVEIQGDKKMSTQ